MNLYTNLTQAYQRLIGFSRLEFNWDSTGANAIDQQAIDNGSSFLNYLVKMFTPTQVNPLPSGRVEMRWKGPEYELCLEFTRKSRVIYSLHPLKDGLCIKQGVANSMSECMELFLTCFRPEVTDKRDKKDTCDLCVDQRYKNLPY